MGWVRGLWGLQKGELRLRALMWVDCSKLVTTLVCKACPTAEVAATRQV